MNSCSKTRSSPKLTVFLIVPKVSILVLFAATRFKGTLDFLNDFKYLTGITEIEDPVSIKNFWLLCNESYTKMTDENGLFMLNWFFGETEPFTNSLDGS